MYKYAALLLLVLVMVMVVDTAHARHINAEGVALIKHYEGYFPNFYKDPVVGGEA